MSIFVNSILPLCNRYDGNPNTPNCVVGLDGASTHVKTWVKAECQRKGVIPLFFPPHGYVLNPTELVINVAKMRMMTKYGMNNIYPMMAGRKVGDIFAECVYEVCTPANMRSFYNKCGIP